MDKINNANKFVEKPGMPIAISKVIKPILLDLSKYTLLVKCLHGKTQNPNKALNNLIWKKCPKNIYNESEVLEMGVCSAITNFNDAARGTLNVLRNANMERGYFTAVYCSNKNSKGIVAMNPKSSTVLKASCKEPRVIRQNYIDENKNKEGVFKKLVHFDKAVSV